jgi:prespore-specific regulator
MKVRQDAWTDEDDLLLAETVLRHVREGSTQLNAFEEVGDKLNRTSAACGFRWNAVVRHRYEKALQLSKKQRKQRQRILGKDQGGKKKLLYSPPETAAETFIQPAEVVIEAVEEHDFTTEMATETYALPEVQTYVKPTAESYVNPTAQTYVKPTTESYVNPVAQTYAKPTTQTYVNPAARQASSGLTLDSVIDYLQNFHHSNLQNEALKSENERLKREIDDLRRQNEAMEAKISGLEQSSETIQEDYETLMKIMNRARKLVLFEEEERPATKFKMDRNGNLEKLAE